MPAVGGAQVASRLQALEIPFVLISAYDETDVRAAAHALGARTYLVKPTTEEDLTAAIALCAEGRNE